MWTGVTSNTVLCKLTSKCVALNDIQHSLCSPQANACKTQLDEGNTLQGTHTVLDAMTTIGVQSYQVLQLNRQPKGLVYLLSCFFFLFWNIMAWKINVLSDLHVTMAQIIWPRTRIISSDDRHTRTADKHHDSLSLSLSAKQTLFLENPSTLLSNSK